LIGIHTSLAKHRLDESEANEGILDKIINSIMEPQGSNIREKAERLAEVNFRNKGLLDLHRNRFSSV
jgi:flagellar biosynthesis/type III secretory pathway chaperone